MVYFYTNSLSATRLVICFSPQSGLMIAPVLANLGPLEELSFKPNPGEVIARYLIILGALFSDQRLFYTVISKLFNN